jgi:hypothetical protein
MGTLILATLLTCGELSEIVNRLENSKSLTSEQKVAILNELKSVASSCPVEIQTNEKTRFKI